LNFDRFLKNTHIANFIKICPVGAKLLHADRWTDKMKLLFAILRMHVKIQIFMVEEDVTSILKVKAVCSSTLLVTIYQTTQCHTAEQCSLFTIMKN
jgi:hypothetical protein